MEEKKSRSWGVGMGNELSRTQISRRKFLGYVIGGISGVIAQ